MITAAAWRRALWHATGQALTAHVVMLRDVAVLDDASAAAVLNTIDAIRRGEPPETESSLSLVATFDERFDSQSAATVAGAARIARARHDLAATAQRLALRDLVLDLADSRAAAQGALIDLAEDHVFTLLNAWSGSAPLQPTNLAHYLSGVIAPLGRAGRRMQTAYSDLDRSPMGSAALVGPALPVDREETAELLGTEGPVESTFDALSAVDHLDAVASAAVSIVVPPRRLLDGLLFWLRTEPSALRLADELLARPDANLPHFRPPAALERIVSEAEAVEDLAAVVSRATSRVALAPTGDSADRAAEQTASALTRAAGVCAALATMVSGPIEINRAWLARGAGRDLVTSGDLADFLLAEEALDPVSARDVASLTAQRARQEGLEASAITPALIDSAALLVIGRELGIELERLGGVLAPRRFIEKRTLLGGPAAPAVREYLTTERGRLQDDLRWIAETRARIAMAAENLEIRRHEILAAASTG